MIYFTKLTNKMQLCRIIYCSLTDLHVSSDIFAHHQEHLNCIHSFWYCLQATTYVNNTRSCEYILDAPDDEQKYRWKHVEQSRNNKLSYTVAFVGQFVKLLSIGPDSSFVIANDYGLDGPGIESRWGRDIPPRPDRPWGPPSLLYNGYRVFPGAKVRPVRAADHPPHSSAEVLKE